VSLSAATDTPFGAKDQINCAVGQELVFCSMDGVCLAKSEMRDSGSPVIFHGAALLGK
jgi:hypothetical protein